jgi:choline dehydrogenase
MAEMSGYAGRISTADTFDYVIVGAGSAGCVLAMGSVGEAAARGRPARHPGHHSGARAVERFVRFEVDWMPPQPQPHYAGSDLYPRGKTLGGSSAINAMIYIRGHRTDFDGWSERL